MRHGPRYSQDAGGLLHAATSRPTGGLVGHVGFLDGYEVPAGVARPGRSVAVLAAAESRKRSGD